MKKPNNRLLILDDDALIGETVSVMVQKGGYDAQHTDNPDEFFAKLESWDPAFVVIDLIMPQMDGVEVIAGLADRKSLAKIIISSGADHRVLDAAKRSAHEHGLSIIGVLGKPFTRQTLLDLLDSDGENTAVASHGFVGERNENEIGKEELKQALANRDIFIVVQPKIHCSDSSLAGFEVLARWVHREAGFVPPDIFIALAEKHGLIDELTDQIMQKALHWLADLPEAINEEPGLEGLSTRMRNLSLSLNISALSLDNLSLFDSLSEICETRGIDPGRIILELTETSAMEDPLASLDILTRLRVKGFKLSIDDFGTGYSSMKQLVRLPFSEIKVDRSFVISARDSQESRTIAQSIIELGDSLNLTTAAEGIEDAETLTFLKKIGCDLAQGFYIAKPMELVIVNDWILDYSRECEVQRLGELKDLAILDTPVEERFERHTRVARRLFDVPTAVICLISKNRQWFKSHAGIPDREAPRNISFCTHTIAVRHLMEVTDTLDDKLFRDNPLVTAPPHIRFYAGVPLRGPKGQLVGTFCILDTKPRQLSFNQRERLQALAELVEQELTEGQRGYLDSLTGVLNSNGYDSTARQAIGLARRLNLPTLALQISLDNLPRINKDFGYDVGNSALCELARILQDVLRRADIVGRYGGSTFRALLIDNSEGQADEVAGRLRDRIHVFNYKSDIYTLQCDIKPLHSPSADVDHNECKVLSIDGSSSDRAIG